MPEEGIIFKGQQGINHLLSFGHLDVHHGRIVCSATRSITVLNFLKVFESSASSAKTGRQNIDANEKGTIINMSYLLFSFLDNYAL